MKDTRFRTAAYLRLSKGDGDVNGRSKEESNSISNQRLMIDRFLQDNPDFELVETYVDDGYTGTNFDRPAMQKMMEDIDKGLIDCVIVKDFSRFGREKIETGTFILKTCAEKGIRFISINDNYDSLTAKGSDKHLLMPIKTLTNELYSMDISSKIRASQSVKRERGEFMAPDAPYGYIKDPDNKNHLLIDPEAAKVVRTIFAKKISGMSGNGIANYLKKTGVLTPANYKKSRDPNYRQSVGNLDKCKWFAKQIIRILSNEVYLGSIVQGRQTNVSFKINKRINKPKEEWVVVPNMHEPIISESDFYIVQSLLKRDIRNVKGSSEGYLFAGMLFCGNCGGPMLRKNRSYSKSSHIEYICKSYNGNKGCASHKILEDDLIDAVIASINSMISKLCGYSRLAENLDSVCISKEEAILQNEEINKLKAELENRETFREGLYQDLETGILSSEQFNRFKGQYTKQIEELKCAIKERTMIIDDLYSKGLAADELISKFKQKPRIEELDRVLLVTLIDRILVYDNGTIEIVYRYSNQINVLDEIAEASRGGGKDGKNQKQI